MRIETYEEFYCSDPKTERPRHRVHSDMRVNKRYTAGCTKKQTT